MRLETSCALVSLACLAALAGCSSKGPATIAVDGLVRLDGAPVAGARVLFSPKEAGRPAEGVTDAEGRFVLSTFGPRDGALPGEHVVTVLLVQAATPKGQAAAPKGAPQPDEASFTSMTSPGDERPPQWIVPQRYSDQASSGLTAAVGAGSRSFTFDLTKKR